MKVQGAFELNQFFYLENIIKVSRCLNEFLLPGLGEFGRLSH